MRSDDPQTPHPAPLRREATLAADFPDDWTYYVEEHPLDPDQMRVSICKPGHAAISMDVDHRSIHTKEHYDIVVIDAVNSLWRRALHEAGIRSFMKQGVPRRGVTHS